MTASHCHSLAVTLPHCGSGSATPWQSYCQTLAETGRRLAFPEIKYLKVDRFSFRKLIKD